MNIWTLDPDTAVFWVKIFKILILTSLAVFEVKCGVFFVQSSICCVFPGTIPEHKYIYINIVCFQTSNLSEDEEEKWWKCRKRGWFAPFLIWISEDVPRRWLSEVLDICASFKVKEYKLSCFGIYAWHAKWLQWTSISLSVLHASF